MVDADDYEELSNHNWSKNHVGYAYRRVVTRVPTGEKAAYRLFMHRLINKTPAGLFTDHINHDRSDNRKANLRSVNKSQNSANRPKPKRKTPGSSKYKGVKYNKVACLWEARINYNGSHKTTYHRTEDQAALDYNRLAVEKFGEFAHLNIIPEGTIPTLRKPKTSKYRGVTFHKRSQKWRVSIMLGAFNTELEAAQVYNEASIKLRGEKARINIL